MQYQHIIHKPPHPGGFIKASYLTTIAVSVRFIAKHLQVAAPTISLLLRKESSVNPEMALRLSTTLGRSPESWLQMQADHDLYHTRKPKSKKIDFSHLDDAA